MRKLAQLLNFWILLSTLGFYTGCGNVPAEQVTQEDSACKSGQAQIAVQDSFLQILCGCSNQSNGTIITPPTSLNCTVSTDTVVFFHYQATLLPHQIVSIHSPVFPSSPLSDPKKLPTAHSHAFKLENTGVYQFEDAFNNQLQGKITVQ